MVSLVLLSSCGGSSPEPTDRASNCKRGITNACQRLAVCGGSPLTDPATISFVATCSANLADECTPDRLVCPPSETYHPEQDVACASAFSEWSCAAIIAAGDHFPPPPAPCELICQ